MTAPEAYALTDADRAYFDALAAAASPLTPESRARLRPILAGSIPPRAPACQPQAA